MEGNVNWVKYDQAAKVAWEYVQKHSAGWLMQPLPEWDDLPPATKAVLRFAVHAAQRELETP